MPRSECIITFYVDHNGRASDWVVAMWVAEQCVFSSITEYIINQVMVLGVEWVVDHATE